MVEAVLPCARCKTHIGFKLLGDYRLVDDLWSTHWSCRRCDTCVVVTLEGSRTHGYSPCSCDGSLSSNGFVVVEQHPKPEPVKCPEHVPDRIAANFKEAVANVRAGAFTSAVMMFRKVLERATNALATNAEANGKSLFRCIDDLADQHLLTPAMREWAHVIRDSGNLAVHDTDSDEDTAEQIHEFTELFLTYAFTLPVRVSEYHDSQS